MKPINNFLLSNDLRLADNPCISPDFCLDWPTLVDDIRADRGIRRYPQSYFRTTAGGWSLLENENGDHAWRLEPAEEGAGHDVLESGEKIGETYCFPASFENLARMKNLAQEHDPNCAIFPTAAGSLSRSTLGIGARFTTLHWPGVDWAMSNLGIGVTANQNSIPRELVYDVNAMLSGSLDTVPFPFIGANVPEGHQGQSVEGMSHGCVLAKLKTGFHTRGIPWSFNADHQPIGGKFDEREDQLVAGCLFASYITFDLSPELAATKAPSTASEREAYVKREVDAELIATVAARVAVARVELSEDNFNSLLCYVWPAMKKMKRRDEKYRRARQAAFTTEVGRKYLRELSIDELPGLTEPNTTAVMLALCEAMEMPIDFIAPAFGFQKNMPYPDNAALRQLIERQWRVCKSFDVSIGFHSGSGKSAENYRVMGEVTGGNLEIKTSGRYTYEMGVALSRSSNPSDQALWRDWHAFTVELAVAGAFSEQETEKAMAREFIETALASEGEPTAVFESVDACRSALTALEPSPEHMFWFEYNFLYVLAADGKACKSALGDHSPAGYRQRARFYSISEEGRLEYARRVAEYIIFLAENTGLVPSEICQQARKKLTAYATFSGFLDDISVGICAN